MTTESTLRDQEYLVLNDGRLFSIHGDQHAHGLAVGEVAYVPDRNGKYTIDGKRYSKPYSINRVKRTVSKAGHISYRENQDHELKLWSAFSEKSIVRVNDALHHYSAKIMLDNAHRSEHWPAIEKMIDLSIALFFPENSLQIGLTGSLGVSDPGTIPVPHDFDLTIRSPKADEIGAVVARLQERITADSSLRLHEHGKYWRIRANTATGILCPFFASDDSIDRNLVSDDKPLQEENSIVGKVIDATFTATLPVELTVAVEGNSCKVVYIISYDLRARGEFSKGDKGEFIGKPRFIIRNGRREYALLVGSAGQMKNLTPPWSGFHE